MNSPWGGGLATEIISQRKAVAATGGKRLEQLLDLRGGVLTSGAVM
jgi:hypothetical protein